MAKPEPDSWLFNLSVLEQYQSLYLWIYVHKCWWRNLRVHGAEFVILTFVLPVPGAAVLLTTSVIHAVQDDQRKGDQL